MRSEGYRVPRAIGLTRCCDKFSARLDSVTLK